MVENNGLSTEISKNLINIFCGGAMLCIEKKMNLNTTTATEIQTTT